MDVTFLIGALYAIVLISFILIHSKNGTEDDWRRSLINCSFCSLPCISALSKEVLITSLTDAPDDEQMSLSSSMLNGLKKTI